MRTENSRILNSYKLLALFRSYKSSMKKTRNSSANNALLREPMLGHLLSNENFSEIDDARLNGLAGMFNKPEDKWNKMYNGLEELLENIVKQGKLPKRDIPLLKKLGIKNLSADKIWDDVCEVFKDSRSFCVTAQNLENDLLQEIQRRERETEKFTAGKGESLDDGAVLLFKQKLKKCESFDDVNDLLLYYTTGQGCDYINGFLRGDMSLSYSAKNEIKSSWGSSLTVPVSILIDTVIKSLKLKKELMYGVLEDKVTVYRGTSLEKLLPRIGVTEEMVKAGTVKAGISYGYSEDEQEDVDDEDKKQWRTDAINEFIVDGHSIYLDKGVTSTSLSQSIARGHAKRKKTPTLLSINLVKGTAFGKDLSKKFGDDDYNQEVILKPGQKIKFVNAYYDSGRGLYVLSGYTVN